MKGFIPYNHKNIWGKRTSFSWRRELFFGACLLFILLFFLFLEYYPWEMRIPNGIKFQGTPAQRTTH